VSCPNPDECDGKCRPLKDVVHEIDAKLNNVYEFIVSFFEDDDNIQPIKKELQSVIDKLK
jgi:phage tail sheath gpL-like